MKTEARELKTDDGRRNPASRITEHISRVTHHASRITDHIPRVTHHASRITSRSPKAFTLIELLVVISIIAVLAALTFPAVGAVKIAMLRARAKSELVQLQTAIERFHQKLGYYPPDNATNWAVPPLYYELLGTTNDGVNFHTLDGSAQIPVAILASGATPFGAKITGFVNCSRPSRGDDAPGGTAFVNGFKPNQFMAITNGTAPTPCSVLGSGLDGPLVYQTQLGVKLNPWRYNSSNPRYNTKSYDLWIDVTAGGKTNRICNWSEKAIIVSTPL